MPKLRNVSPLGDLEVDGVGFVEAGATFEVDDEVADRFTNQAEVFEVVDTKPAKPTKVEETNA